MSKPLTEEERAVRREAMAQRVDSALAQERAGSVGGRRKRARSTGPIQKEGDEERPRNSGSQRRQRGQPALVAFLPEERTEVDQRAARAGLSLAAYLRACGLGEAGPRARRAPTVNAEELAKAVAKLVIVGNIVDEIAEALSNGDPYDRVKADAAYAAIGEAIAAINEAVGRAEPEK